MEIVKFKIGRYLYPVTLTRNNSRIEIQFPYNKEILEEIKCFEGRKWHGHDPVPKKVWSFPDTKRNRFALEFLKGNDPYHRFNEPYGLLDFHRPLYMHQTEMVQHMVTRRQSIIAGEMGTGKTLAAIELLERVGKDKLCWYVGPKSAINAVKYDFNKWNAQVIPKFLTYDEVVRILKDWKEGYQTPYVLILDESSKLKNHTTQRWKAISALIEEMFLQHGEPYITLMSGSPAPKSPLDWWAQCELACPGFIKEGNLAAFRNRLAIVKSVSGDDGVPYPKIVGWKDKEKCEKCGEDENHSNHTIDHPYTPCINEVSKLYKRMKGLVLVKLKKDCIDLPDKIYKEIELPVSEQTQNYADLLKGKATRAIQLLTWLRELSDGFLYTDEPGAYETCEGCKGTGMIHIPEDDYCPACYGVGKRQKLIRETQFIETPKDDALKDILEEHIDIGRLVVYGGFTGTVDKIVRTVTSQGWKVLRVDGRGWHLFNDKMQEIDISNKYIEYFQDSNEPNVCFVGQADSAGMGLTLTRSPTIVFYSNTFKGESRIQAEDRIHRIGMDKNRGATIIDLLHLKTDKFVLDNIKKKRKLQSLSLGEIIV